MVLLKEQKVRANNNQWSDIPSRILTICVGVPLLWIVWTDNATRLLFFQGTHAVIYYEWMHMTKLNQLHYSWIFFIVSIILSNITDTNMFHAVLVCFVGITTVLTQDTQRSRRVDASAIIQSIFLVTIPFRYWLIVTKGTNGFIQTVSLLLTVWNCDTGALVSGRIFGKRESYNNNRFRQWLFQISPKKSMEGLIGGILFGTITYALLPWFWKYIVVWNLVPSHIISTIQFEKMTYYNILVGVILSLAAILGDLWESSLKRQYSVKDSGKALPGHGGVLDRFDSSLVAVIIYSIIIDPKNFLRILPIK